VRAMGVGFVSCSLEKGGDGDGEDGYMLYCGPVAGIQAGNRDPSLSYSTYVAGVSWSMSWRGGNTMHADQTASQAVYW